MTNLLTALSPEGARVAVGVRAMRLDGTFDLEIRVALVGEPTILRYPRRTAADIVELLELLRADKQLIEEDHEHDFR
jgi:hypothetical protein